MTSTPVFNPAAIFLAAVAAAPDTDEEPSTVRIEHTTPTMVVQYAPPTPRIASRGDVEVEVHTSPKGTTIYRVTVADGRGGCWRHIRCLTEQQAIRLQVMVEQAILVEKRLSPKKLSASTHWRYYPAS
jgi:hypothetical protein